VLEFVIKFKDQLGTGLASIGANVEKTFAKMDARGKVLGNSIQGINTKLDALQRTRDISLNLREVKLANKEIAALEKQKNKLTGNTGGGGLSVMGLAKGFIGLQAVKMAGEGIIASIGGAMERGATNTSFGVLTGSKGNGDKLTGDLAKLSADTILGPGVFKNAQTMLSFGVEAKNIMPIMKMLGDISGGSQDKLDGLALAFANTASAGKLTGQDLLQYVNAGFNPLNEISRTTGKSMSSLRKDMEDGNITVKMVADSMSTATSKGGRFNDMLNKAAETPYGKFQKLQGQLQEVGIKLGNALMPAVSALLDLAGPALDVLASGIDKVQSFLMPLFGKIKPVFTALQPLFKAMADVSLPWFEHVKGFISKVITTLAPILVNIANIVSSVLGPAFRLVYPILGKLLDLLGWIIEKVGWAIEKLTWLFSKIAEGIGWVLDKAVSVTRSKTAIIADAIKSGLSDNQMSQFFKKVGELHGSNYMGAMMDKIGQAAKWADMFYNTNFFSNKFNDIKSSLSTKTPVLKTATGAGSYNFSGTSGADATSKDKEKVGKDVNGITGGGTRNTYISLGKFLENVNFYNSSAKEGLDQMQEMLEDCLLRVLNSAQ